MRLLFIASPVAKFWRGSANGIAATAAGSKSRVSGLGKVTGIAGKVAKGVLKVSGAGRKVGAVCFA